MKKKNYWCFSLCKVEGLARIWFSKRKKEKEKEKEKAQKKQARIHPYINEVFLDWNIINIHTYLHIYNIFVQI